MLPYRTLLLLLGSALTFTTVPSLARAAPVVSTIAGTGRADTIDGVATAAAFLVPAAVAVAADGTIYVADAGAQDIRRIAHGRVDTIAGRSDRGAGSDVRTGGYADGSAKTARFSRPLGIVVAKDGALYVADSGNNCIRKIANGTVSTFAGSNERGAIDGPASAARFENIRALAIDGDGDLYVADYGVGIRKIDRNGAVTTLTLPSIRHTVLGVAAQGTGAHVTLAYADTEAMHLVVGGVHQTLAYDEQREPNASGLTVGFADAIAIVNENTLVVCDIATNAVRIVRFPSPPFVTDAMTRALAGGIREGGDVAGGLADGSPETALVSVPLGVALAPDGSLIVADAGNRRIRRIAHVDFRESVLANLSNLTFPKNAYNLAIVGNSYAFFNVLWPESMAGEIEAGLGRDGARIGLSKRPYVNDFRVDGLDSSAQMGLIENDLGDGQVALIVLLANYYEPPDQKLLRDLQQRLEGKRTKLLVVFTPQGFEVSPLEFWKASVTAPDYDYAALHERGAREESYVRSLGARSLLLLDAMQREELDPNRRNFFYGADHHLTVFGTQWVGRQILDELERWRPWQ
jgi:sugar lactone lactonase YvrE